MDKEQFPAPKPGREVAGLTGKVAEVYREVRHCIQAGSWTSAVLAMRVLILHVANEKGGKKHSSFKTAVDYLQTNGYVAAPIAACVDFVRDEANEANHDLRTFTEPEASTLLTFTGFMLLTCYEAEHLLQQAKGIEAAV